jgi:hypothetical protein
MFRDEDFDRSLEIFRNDVETQWQATQPSPPEVVYHYTSPRAFRQIIESRRLWATVTSELNDFRELRHAADSFTKVLRRHAHASFLPEYQVLYPPQVLEMDYTRSDMAEVFVASLSGSEDDLPQWCMYADHFFGVSLGFDAPALTALDGAVGLRQSLGFFAISYAHDEQEAFFEWFVSRWEREASAGVANGLHLAHDPLMFMASWFGNLATAALSIFPRMKSRHFRTENEWRLAHLHIPKVDCCPVVHTSGKPHVELDLAQIAPFPLKVVWLGPGVSNRQSRDVVRCFLDENGFNDVRVELSDIPLRGTPRALSLDGRPTGA